MNRKTVLFPDLLKNLMIPVNVVMSQIFKIAFHFFAFLCSDFVHNMRRMHICPPTTREYVSVSFCDFEDVGEDEEDACCTTGLSFFSKEDIFLPFPVFILSFATIFFNRPVNDSSKGTTLPVRMRIMMIVMRKRIKYYHRLFAACTSLVLSIGVTFVWFVLPISLFVSGLGGIYTIRKCVHFRVHRDGHK